MTELNKCVKCKSVPELVDGRTRWFARCDCPAGDNVVYGQSVSFLDHINVDDDDELTDKVSGIVFDLVPWDKIKQSAIDAWNTHASQSEWVDLSERPPVKTKSSKQWLCKRENGKYVAAWWNHTLKVFYVGYTKFDDVTHWSALS